LLYPNARTSHFRKHLVLEIFHLKFNRKIPLGPTRQRSCKAHNKLDPEAHSLLASLHSFINLPIENEFHDQSEEFHLPVMLGGAAGAVLDLVLSGDLLLYLVLILGCGARL
jgi:hypothetical protein